MTSLSYLELCEAHHRRSVRLRNHAYAEGIYFVTICTRNRERLFGEIVDGEMRLNEYAIIATEEWLKTAYIRPYVHLDAYVIMPNHVHGILIIESLPLAVGACRRHAPTRRAFAQPSARSLSMIINHFKSTVTKRIRSLPGGYNGHLWQRNYHEHIIRSRPELERIRDYIERNPYNWDRDPEKV